MHSAGSVRSWMAPPSGNQQRGRHEPDAKAIPAGCVEAAPADDEEPPSQAQKDAVGPSTPPPSAVDWQRIRQPVQPSKSSRRAEWITHWSSSVACHGDEAYCACSDASSEASQGAAAPSYQAKTKVKPATPPAACATTQIIICRTCSRPPAPSHRPTADKLGWRVKLGQLARRIGGRSSAEASQAGTNGTGTGPGSATAQIQGKKQQQPGYREPSDVAADVARAARRIEGRGTEEGDEEEVDIHQLSSSGAAARPSGLLAAQARLQRAQKLLARSGVNDVGGGPRQELVVR